MNWHTLKHNLELEVASLGFASDPRPNDNPPSWEGVKSPNRHRTLRTRVRKALLWLSPPERREYDHEYRRKQRERWLRKGIVPPRNDAERLIAAEGER